MTLRLTRSAAASLAIAIVLSAPGCGSEPTPSAPTEPACEPRAISEPGRLNIYSRAENHGMVPPCQVTLTFSIAANTKLRGLEGTIRITDVDENPLDQVPLSVMLAGPEGGMFRGKHEVPPVPGHFCRGTSLLLDIQRCAGANGSAIACPEVRVRPSHVLLGLKASGDGISVCYDE